MLYDDRYAGQFDAQWFDPAHWQARGDARATAGGRGASWFVAGIEPWVLRRYRRGGMVGRLVSDSYLWLGEARARPIAEWRLLAWAHDAGLPVPRPVAARFERHGLLYRGALITAQLDAQPLAALIATASTPDAARFRAAGTAIARCHAAGLDHADLNLHNLLIDADGRASVIDWDRGVKRAAAGAWREANLARLRRSLEKETSGWDAAPRAAAWAALRQAYDAAR